MAPITLEQVTKVYPNGFEAVHELDLDVGRRRVHGARRPVGMRQDDGAAHGRRPRGRSPQGLRIGDRVVNDVAPKDRDIAMVFQNYALYPHMTVAAEHRLRAASCGSVPEAEIRQKVARGRRRSSA